MNWKEMMNNRKGFFHHPETPKEDKILYIQYKEKAHELLTIGEQFILNNGVLTYRDSPRKREEFGTKSKYLHRGVYCPSPILDIFITNSKRGRILTRPSEQSRITNRYVYDASDKLLFSDNYIDEKMVSTEYLIYQDNFIYGVTIGMDGRIISISEEKYVDKKLTCYISAFYSIAETGLCCTQFDCEKYYYDEVGLLDWDYCQIFYSWENIAPSGFIKHNRYRFLREEGYLKSFYLVTNNGMIVPDSEIYEIKLKRKA